MSNPNYQQFLKNREWTAGLTTPDKIYTTDKFRREYECEFNNTLTLEKMEKAWHKCLEADKRMFDDVIKYGQSVQKINFNGIDIIADPNIHDNHPGYIISKVEYKDTEQEFIKDSFVDISMESIYADKNLHDFIFSNIKYCYEYPDRMMVKIPKYLFDMFTKINLIENNVKKPDSPKLEEKMCHCGAEKISSNVHSDYCPKYIKEQE